MEDENLPPSGVRRRSSREPLLDHEAPPPSSARPQGDLRSGPAPQERQPHPIFARVPPLQSPHWRAPGGDRDPQGQLQRVCSDDLQEGALRGDLGLVRRLVQAGASVNAPLRSVGEEEYVTLLHVLASLPAVPNSTRIIMELMESAANPNARSSMGGTPLMRAALHKNTGAMEVLLAYGAKTDPVDDRNYTALRYAMVLQKGPRAELSAEVARQLAAAKARLDHGGERPPITEAVVQRNSIGAQTLLEVGAPADGLHEAVVDGQLPMIQMLVKNFANPFSRDAQGTTVMEAALSRGDNDITTALRNYIGDLERAQHPLLQMRRLQEDESLDIHPRKGGLQRANPLRTVRAKQHLSRLGRARARVQHSVRHIYKGPKFQFLMFLVLLLALFLPDLWVISNATDTDALDTMLLIILGAFLLEFTLQLIGEWKTYFLSFAFWMDIVGLLSVPLDHSLVTSLLMSNVDLDGATLARATKIVKLGVRSMRFSRLVKLIRFLPDSKDDVGSTAKKMAAILGKKISIQVSCLIIMTVMVLPTIEFFMFPENDYSGEVWTTLLHRAAMHHPADLPGLLDGFEDFYGLLAYFPYEVHSTNPNGTMRVYSLTGREPARIEDRTMIEAGSQGSYHTEVYFNFAEPNRIESICNCLLILSIIVIMFTSASLVTSSVSKIVLGPLERLLNAVQSIAGQIFSSVHRMTGGDEEEDDGSGSSASAGSGGFADETKLIAKVLKKLTALSEITARRMPIDDFEQLDEGHRALLQDFVGRSRVNQVLDGENVSAEQVRWGLQHLEAEGLDASSLERWDFHVGELSERQRLALCTGLLLLSHGSGGAGDATRRRAFVEAICEGYANQEAVKYHNWLKATDAGFTMFRCLKMVKAEQFISSHERFALLVSALSHDIGHPGLNNAFLIETRHDLAIKYNDVSPLEHMHCARLFQILANTPTNVFVDLKGSQYKEARQVCIESILHTDNQKHFALLSELQVAYETCADLLDGMADVFASTPEEYPMPDLVDFYCTQDTRRLLRASLVHFVDLTSAMKPWRICKFWAELVFEEFFQQGDAERAMGLPVQPINDRDKISKAQVQMGYTEFFVAPMAVTMAKLFPPLRVCRENLHDNLDKWTRRWGETKPSRMSHETSITSESGGIRGRGSMFSGR